MGALLAGTRRDRQGAGVKRAAGHARLSRPEVSDAMRERKHAPLSPSPGASEKGRDCQYPPRYIIIQSHRVSLSHTGALH